MPRVSSRQKLNELQLSIHNTCIGLCKFFSLSYCLLYRYQFVLQVKRDIVQGRLPVPFDVAAELGAWALQCELSNKKNKEDYRLENLHTFVWFQAF